MSLASELRDFHGRWTSGGQGDKGTDKITKALRGKRDDAARNAINGGKAPDTKSIHTDANGAYTPEREALHHAIIEHFMRHSAPQEHPQAIFTAGGAASGKSTLAGQKKDDAGNLTADNMPVPRGHVYINPDDIKAMLPEYKALQASGRSDIAASATHEESSQIARALTVLALDQRRHVVVDGTGNSNVGKFGNKLRAARDLGYSVQARYAHIPVEEAITREKKRAIKSGRKVDESTLRGQHKTVAQSFVEDVASIPGIHVQILSTAGRGRPTMIAEKHPGKSMRVTQSQKYGEFLAKAVA